VRRRLNGLAALAFAGAMAGLAFYAFGWQGGESQPHPKTSPEQADTTTTATSTVFRISSRPARFGPSYAGIRQGKALHRARQLVISTRKYGGDDPLFYRNTGDAAITRTTRIGGHSAWLIQFEDGQVQRVMCVAVRRRASRVIAASEVRCGRN
jgi:hypothetical protein